MAEFTIKKVNTLPESPEANSIYLIKPTPESGYIVQMYVVDNSGIANPVSGSLNDALSIGNSSSIGMIVGGVKALNFSFSDPDKASLLYLGTDENGKIVKANTPGTILPFKLISADYTLTNDDYAITVENADVDVTINLPDTPENGRRFLIFNYLGTGLKVNVYWQSSLLFSIDNGLRWESIYLSANSQWYII